VTLTYGGWDNHGRLCAQGMLNDMGVVACGEFGRTPQVNAIVAAGNNPSSRINSRWVL